MNAVFPGGVSCHSLAFWCPHSLPGYIHQHKVFDDNKLGNSIFRYTAMSNVTWTPQAFTWQVTKASRHKLFPLNANKTEKLRFNDLLVWSCLCCTSQEIFEFHTPKMWLKEKSWDLMICLHEAVCVGQDIFKIYTSKFHRMQDEKVKKTTHTGFVRNCGCSGNRLDSLTSIRQHVIM